MASRPKKNYKTPKPPFCYNQLPRKKPMVLDGPASPEMTLWPDDCDEPKPSKRLRRKSWQTRIAP
jgi:hypothetical protein